MKQKKIIALVLSTMLAFSMLTGCAAKSETPAQSSSAAAALSQSQSGSAASGSGNLKTFKADTLAGGSFTQNDFTKKDITVINFWSLECGPCVDELPSIAKFSKTLPDNVQLITVNMDETDKITESAVKEELKKAGFDGTTLAGGDGDLKTFVSKIQYTPTTILVDKDGNTLGDGIVGSPSDLAKAYTDAINSALKSIGKAQLK